jgi:hypothetical protein
MGNCPYYIKRRKINRKAQKKKTNLCKSGCTLTKSVKSENEVKVSKRKKDARDN